MKEWLRETHGPGFELLRHFLRRFFDSDLITTPGQMAGVLIGALPVFFQWFFLLVGPLHHKYEYLSQLATSGPYREAVRADELWLITLMMSAIGLLTAIKWQFLFPDLRDYRALGALPLGPLQIFGSKLTALLLIAAAALITVNFLPSVGFPVLSAGRWAFQSSLGARIMAHAGASLAASCFFFFGLIALQGILLNVLRPRTFGRVTGYLQGILVALMLSLIVLSFSIQPQITRAALRPEWAPWLPPVWFLGLYQTLSGDTGLAMRVLANRALIALAIAMVLALLSYLLNYRRHRALMMDGSTRRTKEWRLGSALPGVISHNPRQQAAVAFMLQTLARSNHHRMILMAYGGVGFAVFLTGIVGMGKAFAQDRLVAADFVYYHILALLFLLIGARHVFSLPTELKANWIFQITESEGRLQWLCAVDRFVLLWGAAPLLLLPLPAEFRLLGWRGVAEAGLFLAVGLLAYEWAFHSWDKLPFTCSHLPGKTPVGMVLGFFGLLGVLALVHTVLLAALYNDALFASMLSLLLFAWWRIHRARRQGWVYLRLKYEEVPALAVHALNLLR
jgi:hypothetical protein